MTNNYLNENSATITGMDLVDMVPANIVPENERAVDSEVVYEDKKVTLDVFNPYASALSMEDLAIEPTEVSKELEKATKKGFFSPVIGMARLTNILNGKYFAQICIDEKGYRRIEICQEYETGGFSPKIIIKQSDFLRAASYKFGEANIPQRKMKNAVENFLLRLSSECLDKFDGTMSFDFMEILRALGACYRSLPVHNDFNKEETSREFYRRTMEILRGNEMYSMDEKVGLYGHKSYYPLNWKDIEYVAQGLDMKASDFLKKLKEFNLLYLANSSRGYQTNVRITVEGEDGPESYTEWRYCILRLEYLASK